MLATSRIWVGKSTDNLRGDQFDSVVDTELFGTYFDPNGETLYDVGFTDAEFDWVCDLYLSAPKQYSC
jgi:hypothetical protein